MEEDEDFQIDFDDDDDVHISSQAGRASSDMFGEGRADSVGVIEEAVGSDLQMTSSAVGDLLRKMKVVDQQLNEANRVIVQLMIACETKRDMEQCISKREGRPLHCAITVVRRFHVDWLSSGSSIVHARLSNRSRHVLEDYTVCISTAPLDGLYGSDSNNATTSRLMALPSLPPDANYICQILCEDTMRLPYLVRCELRRQFEVDDDRKTILIRLDDHLLTVWDLVKERTRVHFVPARVTATDAVQPPRRRTAGESSITSQFTLPESFLFLVCRGEATEKNALQWLLPSCSISQSDASDLTICGHFDVSMNVSCRRVGSAFNFCLSFSSPTWKSRLLRALAARISIFLRSATRFPATLKDHPEAIRSFAAELDKTLSSDDENIDRLLQVLFVLFPIA
uniref:Uncharacterized protein n=1 Tax=Plectus sambesii TaxID=2011161 RepID=A0A914W818_9BILA